MHALENHDRPVLVYTGPIHSGKTTTLMNGLAKTDGVAGILTPDVNGVRTLYDLKTRTYHPFQIKAEDSHDQGIVSIGRFAFHELAFVKARSILAAAVQGQPRLLIIDEIGRLELRHEGFEPQAGKIIRAHQAGHFPGDLLIVVRDTLLAEVVNHYQLQRYQVLHSGDLRLSGLPS